jgi:tetratricopeptide (TPR) repeat protein
MADDSWYRRRTWTSDDQAAFFERLRRSRDGFHKAQYCRIQAYELQQAGHFQAALDLLELLMANWHDDAQQAAVYHQSAECLENLGDKQAAIAAYRSTFEVQRKTPGWITNAHLDFGLLVTTLPAPHLYDEALAVLDEFEYESPFPIQEYQAALARALIWDAKGDRLKARRHAKAALAAASKTHSGFTHHARLGLVENVSTELHGRIERIAND